MRARARARLWQIFSGAFPSLSLSLSPCSPLSFFLFLPLYLLPTSARLATLGCDCGCRRRQLSITQLCGKKKREGRRGRKAGRRREKTIRVIGPTLPPSHSSTHTHARSSHSHSHFFFRGLERMHLKLRDCSRSWLAGWRPWAGRGGSRMREMNRPWPAAMAKEG